MVDDVFKIEFGKTNISLTIASVAGKQRISKRTKSQASTLPRRKQTVSMNVAKREEKTRFMLLDDRQHATESSHIASTKEVVEKKTAKKQHACHICCQPHETAWLLQELGGTFSHSTRERFDDQSDFRADTGTLRSVQDRDGTTQFRIFPSQPWRQETKSSKIRRASWRFDQQPRFSEDAGDADPEHKSW